MIRRFAYHAFWNFYDYLGTLCLFGAIYALTVLGVLILSAQLDAAFGPVAGLGFMVVGELLITILTLSALMPFCARAARSEPARWIQLRPGVKQTFWPTAKVLVVWSAVIIILTVNFRFYSRLQTRVEAGPVQLFLLAVNSVIGWAVVVLQILLPVWMSAATAEADKPLGLKASFKAGIMAFALSPAMWIIVYLLIVFTIVSGLYTRITFIFVLPVFASLSQTAYHLSVQYVGFIGDARKELGGDLPVRRYKSRAKELALSWEYRQPRRTIKELIRPWEY